MSGACSDYDFGNSSHGMPTLSSLIFGEKTGMGWRMLDFYVLCIPGKKGWSGPHVSGFWADA